jgi:hypothetical protein
LPIKIPAESFLKVKVQIIGILEEEIPPPWQGPRGEIFLESPVTLHYLLTEVLKIRDTDKVVLVNGKHRTPIYGLEEGDEIQIFPRLDGG